MNMPKRLSKIGDLERSDHYHLPADAQCYFWGEYTPHEHTNGLKWDYSATNKLIGNFKKKLDRRGMPDWKYKQQAIQHAAHAFSVFWKWEVLLPHNPVLIPMPPSKARIDPLYDQRMVELLNLLAAQVQLPLDIRDCLSFNGRFAASHESDDRPSPEALYEEMHFDPVSGKIGQKPGAIFLFDDMLTSGAHYVAAVRKLEDVFPKVPVLAQFVSRRRLPNPFEGIDDDGA